MRTHEDAYADARPAPAFSNGTEGQAWTANWCDQCVHDRGPRVPADHPEHDDTGCPLLLVALLGRTPREWTEKPWKQIVGRPEGETAPTLGDKYECAEYVHDPDTDDTGGGDDDPPPAPEPPPLPGQTDLLEPFFDELLDPWAGRQPDLIDLAELEPAEAGR